MTENQIIADLIRAKDAYRFFIDATEQDLRDRGITRPDALRRARDLDAKLPTGMQMTMPAWSQQTTDLAPSRTAHTSPAPKWLVFNTATCFVVALFWTIVMEHHLDTIPADRPWTALVEIAVEYGFAIWVGIGFVTGLVKLINRTESNSP